MRYFYIIVWYIALCVKGKKLAACWGNKKQQLLFLLNASLKEKELKAIYCRLKFGGCL